MVNGTPVPDSAGLLPPISADCAAGLPWLGLHRGRDEVKEFLAHMHRNLELTGSGPREVIRKVNRAAAFGWFGLHALPTADIVYSIRFECTSLITKYHFFENTCDVARAFRTDGDWVLETDDAIPARSVVQ